MKTAFVRSDGMGKKSIGEQHIDHQLCGVAACVLKQCWFKIPVVR
jgi:hypothetical protein